MTPRCRAQTDAPDVDGIDDDTDAIHDCHLDLDHVGRREDHECDCGAQWAIG